MTDATLKLAEAPAGKQPFRTVVDELGTGDPIQKYNEVAQETTRGIDSAFAMEKMLGSRKRSGAAGGGYGGESCSDPRRLRSF